MLRFSRPVVCLLAALLMVHGWPTVTVAQSGGLKLRTMAAGTAAAADWATTYHGLAGSR